MDAWRGKGAAGRPWKRVSIRVGHQAELHGCVPADEVSARSKCACCGSCPCRRPLAAGRAAPRRPATHLVRSKVVFASAERHRLALDLPGGAAGGRARRNEGATHCPATAQAHGSKQARGAHPAARPSWHARQPARLPAPQAGCLALRSACQQPPWLLAHSLGMLVTHLRGCQGGRGTHNLAELLQRREARAFRVVAHPYLAAVHEPLRRHMVDMLQRKSPGPAAPLCERLHRRLLLCRRELALASPTELHDPRAHS